MRRLGTLALTALLVLLPAACGDDGPAGTGQTGAGTDDPVLSVTDSATDGTEDTDELGRNLAELFARGIREAAGGRVTDEQAECVADGLVERVGANELIELTGTAFEDLPSGVRREVIAVVVDCLPPEVILDLGLDTDTT